MKEGRNATANVVCVGLDEEEMGYVREAIHMDAVLTPNAVSFDEAIDVAQGNFADVVLVGFERDIPRAERLARELIEERVEALLIAVAKKDVSGAAKKAMRVGYDDFITLPEESDQLRSKVKDAAANLAENQAVVVAFMGSKGGVGTSFLAAQFAAELAVIHRVLVIDADFSSGDLAPMLDIIPRTSVPDLLSDPDLDERQLASAAYMHPSKVQFICQPNQNNDGFVATPEAMRLLVEVAANAYQYVVIDLGSHLDAGGLAALKIARQVFLVATPDVVAIRDTHRRLAALEAQGIERTKLNLILNKMSDDPSLEPETIEQNLSIEVKGTVRNDPSAVDHAIGEGRLLREVTGGRQVMQDIARLVGLLSDDPAEVEAAAAVKGPEKKSIFSRLFGRG